MLSIAWVLLIIIITVLVAVILYRAIRENRVQYSSNANSSDPVSYEVLIESLEAETGLVQATLGLRLSQMALLSPQNVALLKEVIPDLPEPHPGTGEISFGSGMSAQEYEKMILSAYGFPENQKWDVKVLFTPQRLVDSTSVFRGVGLLGVQVPSLRPSRPMVPAKLMDAVPSPSRTQLHALGDPWRYPFDRYLVMGKIWGVAYLRYKDQYALLNGETYTISFRLPGYVVKSASVSLLSNWPPMLEPFLAEMLVSGLSGHVV